MFRPPIALLVSLASAFLLIGPDAPAAHAATGDIRQFPADNDLPYEIVPGPDGNLWFTENGAFQIGRITTKGIVTEFPIPGAGGTGITTGPDGNLWFVDFTGNAIDRITPSGAFTQFSGLTDGTRGYITAGPDGNLWFTEGGHIGRITTSGTVTEFSVPSDSNPVAITAGPDGKLWFTDDTDNPAPDRIGRITTSGTVNEYDLPIGHSRPQGIAPGPDGNLWFAEIGSPQEIGKITTSGTITEFPVPCTCGAPYDIGPGPDGNLWSTDFIGLLIRRITPSGTITEFPVPTTSNLLGSAPGPDGNVWFTEVNANNVDRATAAAPKTAYVLSMDAGFAPKTVSLKKQGFTLKWMFLGPNTHSAMDSSGMGLFDSGTHSFVTFFAFKFIAAGSYPYTDTLHPTLTGTVKVPILVKPVTGHTDQAQVTWSSAAPPAGYAFDIQVEQPGSTSFVSWKTGQTATNALFGPADPKYVGAGTYRFQARLRNTGNGKASGYSSAKSITLT